MLGHWVNFCVQFFFNFDDIFLISFSNQIDSKTNLTITTTTTDSVEICASFSWEIKVNDNIDCWYIDSSSNEVGTDKSFELSFSETFKNFCSLFWLHTWMKVSVFIFSFVEFFGQELCSLVGSTEDNALIDNKFWVNFINGFHFISFI